MTKKQEKYSEKQEKEIEEVLTKVKEEKPEIKVDQKDEKIKELTDTLQRVQAEFINYKNRVEKEKVDCISYANADIIKKLLPVMDSFEIALKNTSDPDKFKKGMEMLYAMLFDIMRNEGLMPINSLGKKFDPYKHEVMMKELSKKEDDIILEEFQKGYMLKDKVLRHTKVKISEHVDSKQ